MTTLVPDRRVERRTRLLVEAAPGRPQVRTETSGDREAPGLRPMLIDNGPSGATVCLVPDGALLLAGDAVRLDIEVGSGVHLRLVEPGGTVAYDMRGDRASWDVRIRLGAESTLTWAGEPFVVSSGARVQRSTEVVLGPGARLALRETVVLGRHGERFGVLEQRWRAAYDDGTEVLVEDLHLDGAARRPGILGPHRVLGSVVALGIDLPDGLHPAGRLDLEEGGTVWRDLASEAHRAVPVGLWNAVLDAC